MSSSEPARLIVLQSYDILDTGSEPSFDRIAALAARILALDMAVISFADADRHWYKASHGVAGGSTTRFPSFDPCSDDPAPAPVVIHDVLADGRFATLPAVTGPQSVRFFAAMPLVSPCGHRLGSVAVFHRGPQPDFGDAQLSILADLAGMVMELLAARKRDAELSQTKARMAVLASFDPLTGLVNRQRLRDRLEQTLLVASPDTRVSVMILDLDGLDPLADSLGHPAGDRLLCQVADRLRAAVPHSDIVARFVGGGFAVVHGGMVDERAIIALVRRMLRIAAVPFDIENRRVAFTASVGIATNIDHTADADKLLHQARIALNSAKAVGGGYRVFEGDMGADAKRHQEIRLDLAEALEREQFRLVYQPLMDIRSGRVASFEALLRWQHPVRGLVSPADFIPLAEQTGLIDSIGNWVLHKACQDATGWDRGIGISVNLSPVQFRSAWLPQAVRRALDTAGLPPDRLELEITESVLLPDGEGSLKVLRQLRRMGVRIAMDDFGSGHASFAYLKTFDFDKIKIDQAFVRDMPDHEQSIAIVRAITSLARDLGVATAAEGVENREQLRHLRAESCDQAQGYLFSRPVPYAQVPSLLATLAA